MSEPLLIADDVWDEVGDDKYSGRKHGVRSTYGIGCRGPLCRRSEKLRARERNQYRAEKAGREYQPSYRIKRDDTRETELAAAQEWHERIVAERRAGKAAVVA